MIFPELIENWKSALCSADTYRTVAWHSELVFSCTMNQQGLSRREAQRLLRSEVLLPSTSTHPLARRQVERYIMRGVEYFHCGISTTAVRVYL